MDCANNYTVPTNVPVDGYVPVTLYVPACSVAQVYASVASVIRQAENRKNKREKLAEKTPEELAWIKNRKRKPSAKKAEEYRRAARLSKNEIVRAELLVKAEKELAELAGVFLSESETDAAAETSSSDMSDEEDQHRIKLKATTMSAMKTINMETIQLGDTTVSAEQWLRVRPKKFGRNRDGILTVNAMPNPILRSSHNAAKALTWSEAIQRAPDTIRLLKRKELENELVNLQVKLIESGPAHEQYYRECIKVVTTKMDNLAPYHPGNGHGPRMR